MEDPGPATGQVGGGVWGRIPNLPSVPAGWESDPTADPAAPSPNEPSSTTEVQMFLRVAGITPAATSGDTDGPSAATGQVGGGSPNEAAIPSGIEAVSPRDFAHSPLAFQPKNKDCLT